MDLIELEARVQRCFYRFSFVRFAEKSFQGGLLPEFSRKHIKHPLLLLSDSNDKLVRQQHVSEVHL